MKRDTKIKLAELLRAVRSRELHNLSEARKKVDFLQAELAELRKLGKGCIGGLNSNGKLEPSTTCGADLKWVRFLSVQIETKNAILLQLAADFEEKKSSARRAVGRVSAYDAILAKQATRASHG